MFLEKHVTPDSVLSNSDAGADTQRRFRYQAAYAAILSLKLLNEESEFDEIFCEHHEDILIKLKDGTFEGIQVKTRKEGLEPFKASDPEIIEALKKFIKLEKEFPNRFSRFVLATNYGFWQVKRNGNNLQHILELAQDTKNLEMTSSKSHLTSYVKKFTNIQGIQEDFVLKVLEKTRIQGNLPKFDEIELSLIREIARFPGMEEHGYDVLQQAANSLINAMTQAASLAHDSPIKYYFALLDDPEREKENAIIEGKRISQEIVQCILDKSITSEALLRAYNPVPLSALPRGMSKLELKMAAGRISILSIHLAMDHKFSAEYLLDQWLYKHGEKKANERYEHLRTIVRTECQEAYDSVKNSDEPFGEKMLAEVRRRLRERHSQDKNSLFDCHYEHLLGFSGILTEDCTLWWSKAFEIPEVGS